MIVSITEREAQVTIIHDQQQSSVYSIYIAYNAHAMLSKDDGGINKRHR